MLDCKLPLGADAYHPLHGRAGCPPPCRCYHITPCQDCGTGVPMDIVEPEIQFHVEQLVKDPEEICQALDLLYRRNYAAILESERAIKSVHRGYLELSEPVTAHIFSKIAEGRPFIADDFIGSFSQSSYWMVKTIKQIREAYERQHRRANLLTRMVCN